MTRPALPPLLVATFLLAAGCGGGGDPLAPTGPLQVALEGPAQFDQATEYSFAVQVRVTNPHHGDLGYRLQAALVLADDPTGWRFVSGGLGSYVVPAREFIDEEVTFRTGGQLARGRYLVVIELENTEDPDSLVGRGVHPIEILGPDCTPDDGEEDDTPDEAEALDLSAPRVRNLCYDNADWFRFDVQAGERVGLRLEPLAVRALHLSGTLEGAGIDGALTVAHEPGDIARLTASETGTWFLRVGAGSYEAPGADSAYRVTRVPDLPDYALQLGSLSRSSVPAGDTTRLSFQLVNLGFPKTPVLPVRILLSPDDTPSDDDRVLAVYQQPVGTLDDREGLAYEIVGLPLDVAPGTWWIWADVDAGDLEAELREDNNRLAPLAVEVGEAACTGDAYEDDDRADQATPMALNDFQVHDHCDDRVDWVVFEAEAGQAYRVDITVGALPAEDWDFDLDLVSPEGAQSLERLEGGGWRFTAQATGPHHLAVRTPRPGESQVYTLTVGLDLPDVAARFTQPLEDPYSGLYAGRQISPWMEVETTTALRPASVDMAMYLSADAELDPADTLLLRCTSEARYEWYEVCQPNQASLPPDLAAGTWYAFAVADPDDTLAERDESNNVSPAEPLTIIAPPCRPDGAENDDVLEAATERELPAEMVGNFCDDVRDFSTVPLEQGDVLVVDVLSHEGPLTPTLWVHAPGRDTAAAESGNGLLRFTASEAGRHAVVVGTNGWGAEGPGSSYRAEADLCAFDAADAVAPGALPLAPGDALTLDLCRRATDTFALADPHGLTVSVVPASPTDVIVPTLQVSGDGGATWSTAGATWAATGKDAGGVLLRVRDAGGDQGLHTGYLLTVSP